MENNKNTVKFLTEFNDTQTRAKFKIISIKLEVYMKDLFNYAVNKVIKEYMSGKLTKEKILNTNNKIFGEKHG